MGYASQYFAANTHRVPRARDLSIVMIVPSMNRALGRDLERLGWTSAPLGGGYHAFEGSPHPGFLVIVDEVAAAEHDPLLAAFGHRTIGEPAADREAALWMLAHTWNGEVEMENLEGYEELVAKFLARLPLEKRVAGLTPEERVAGLAPEQRVAGLAPEQRVAGLAPEQRLAGLSPEEALLALPVELLARLPESFIDGLPTTIRDAVRTRLGRLH